MCDGEVKNIGIQKSHLVTAEAVPAFPKHRAEARSPEAITPCKKSPQLLKLLLLLLLLLIRNNSSLRIILFILENYCQANSVDAAEQVSHRHWVTK